MIKRDTRGVGKAHLDRRKAILDAAIDVVDSEGFERLSLRRVASAADVSLGRVQHYFPSKADLISAAFVEVGQGQLDLIHARVDRFGDAITPGSAALLVEQLLHALIPSTAEHRRRVRAEHEMAVYALSFAPLRERITRMRADLVDLIGSLLATAASSPRVADLQFSKREAQGLLASGFGLASYVITDNIDAADAVGVLDRQTGDAIKRLRLSAKPAG